MDDRRPEHSDRAATVAREVLDMVPHRFAPTTLVLTLGLFLTVLGVFPAFAAQPDPAHIRIELAARPEPVVQGGAAARQELEQDRGARWQIEVDPITGVAARGVGGLPGAGRPIAEVAARQAAEEFRARHAALLGAAATTTLRPVRWGASPRAWHATWQQVVSGRPVEGCYLDLLLAEDGDPVAFQSTLVPSLVLPAPVPDLDAARRACEVLTGEPLEIESSESVGVVRADAGRYTGVAALRLELRGRFGARWTALVDAQTREVLELESRIRNELLQGTVTADIKPLYSQDVSVSRTLPWLRVGAGEPEERSTSSDATGGFRFFLNPGTILLRAKLHGQYVDVDNEVAPSPGVVFDAAVPSTPELHFGATEARDDERTIYYHVNVVHDFAKNRFGFDLLDFPVPAVASVHNPASGNPNYANAFWDGSRLAFGNGGGIYENFGLFADVIYHEYTHAITDYMYQPVGGLRGAIGAAIHEALSDYFACTITDEPLVGEYLSGGAGPRTATPPTRNIATVRSSVARCGRCACARAPTSRIRSSTSLGNNTLKTSRPTSRQC
jgi:Thermolysin metallopeptidase, catalytic domain